MKTSIIDYIVKNTDLRQKDLADKLGVSRAQISKWKAGEYLPSSREEALLEIAGLFGDNTEWAIWAKTEQNGRAWIEYLLFMNDFESNDYYHKSVLLADMPDLYVPIIIIKLSGMGVEFPDSAPLVEAIIAENYEFTNFDELIMEYLNYYGCLDTWCSEYLLNLELNEPEISDPATDLGYMVSDIALVYVSKEVRKKNHINEEKFRVHADKTKADALILIHDLCRKMGMYKIPFATDYFDLINKHPGIIDDELEHGNYSNRVEDYLSYGERLLLSEVRITNDMLKRLHEKLDSLPELRK